MKKILLIGLTIFMSFVGFMSCDDWTETEAKSFEAGNGKSAEYYENLRKWKAETDHDMSFGWFGFWSGSGVALNNCMIGLPDSIHLISVWGPWLPSTLDDAKKADMKFVQEVKGTKVMACSFMEYIGQNITPKTTEGRESWGWIWEHKTSGCKNCVSADAAERKRQIEIIEEYAKAIADSVLQGGYDGLDIDYEPTWTNGELSNHKENTEELVRALSKYLGPKSANPHTLLVIDGEVEKLTKETAPYLNYLIQQNYWDNQGATETQLNNRVNAVINALVSDELSAEQIMKMYFSTVNFESYAATGGGNYTSDDGSTTSRLEGHAEWQPTYQDKKYPKGGYGSFHIELEYVIADKNGFYPWTRASINAVHPPKE